MWRELKPDIISTVSSRGPSYEELLEVMTCTTARISLDWMLEKQEVVQGRLTITHGLSMLS